MIEFKLPELGENISAGDVMRVLIKPGDAVANDQAVLELETDKATIEVPSSVAGTVKDVRVKPGEKVKVGQTIFTVDDGGKDAKDTKGAAKDAKDAKGPKEISEPKERAAADKPKPQPEGAAEEGGLSQQDTPARGDGDAGGREQAEEDRDSDKPGVADQPRAQRAAPRLPEDDIEEAPRQKRGEVVDITRGPRSQQGQAATPSEGPPPAAAPSVRRIARELGVDIRQVNGTGPAGRITVDDVQGYVREALSGGGPAAAPAGVPASQPMPDFSKWGDVERKPISNVRRKTAEHLGHAWNVIPHVTQHDKADITALEELRRKYSPMA